MKTATLIALFGSAAALTLTKKGGEGEAPAGGDGKGEGQKPAEIDEGDFEEIEEDGCFLDAFAEGLLDNGLVTEEDLEAAEADWDALDGEEQYDLGEEFFAFADTDGSDKIDIEEGVAAFRAFAGEYLGEEAAGDVAEATDEQIAEQLVEYLGGFDEDGDWELSREEVGLGGDDYYDDYYGDYYGYDDEEGEGPEGPKPEGDEGVVAAQKGGKDGPKPDEDGDDTEEELVEEVLEELSEGTVDEEDLEAVEDGLSELSEGELEGLKDELESLGDASDVDEGDLEDLEAAVEEELEGEGEGPKEGPKGGETLEAQKGCGKKGGDDGDCFFEAAGAGLIESGLVTKDELEAAVAEFEALDEDEQDALAEEIFLSVDTDGDGEVSPLEGATALMDFFGADHEAFQEGSVEDVAAALGEYFGGFDGDDSGALSPEEMTGDVADEE